MLLTGFVTGANHHATVSYSRYHCPVLGGDHLPRSTAQNVAAIDCRGQYAAAILSHFPDGNQSVVGWHHDLAESEKSA
jgi:hypothetical protein